LNVVLIALQSEGKVVVSGGLGPLVVSVHRLGQGLSVKLVCFAYHGPLARVALVLYLVEDLPHLGRLAEQFLDVAQVDFFESIHMVVRQFLVVVDSVVQLRLIKS
jgi:hypothetical protein